MPGPRDAVASALDRAADVAEDAAREQQAAAATARAAARGRTPGSPVDDPDITRAMSTVLHLLGRSIERLAAVVGLTRRVWARALADEKLPLRQIGARLGVSHQRVSALLARHHRDHTRQGVR